MNKSESIIKIAPALLQAQKAMGVAKKDAKNPFFNSKYANLGAVMEACKDALNENGITVLQPVGTDERGEYVETILLHESGEYISDKMHIAIKEINNPQSQGSAITYSRRYSLQSMVFIPAEDDDGNKATEGNIQQPQQTGLKVAENEPQRVNGANAVCWSCSAPSGKPHATNCEAVSPVGGQADPETTNVTCATCGKPAIERKGTTKGGKAYHGIFCSSDDRGHTKWLWD